MSDPIEKDQEGYRDHIATVDETGRRNWIFPKKPQGRYYSARGVVSIFLLVFLFLAPIIRLNGQPLVLLNILERKFIIFGLAFWPQDFHLLALALLTLVVFIILFTVVFGRVFCGWACPQTIFMEMVFRKIEYWIEGDAARQRTLAKAPWSGSKVRKKLLKHAVFYGISFLIGNTFLAYIIGTEELLKIITDPPREHVAGLTAMVIFSFIFYGVFSWFREQVCVLVCPYGRLQGVLLDPNSIVVAYDFERGEPRGKFKKNQTRQNGDCVACQLCVQVCPTGIDIRNGTQLECINCTACMDACDSVMDKINFPRGLIRYTSYKGIVEKAKLGLTPRIVGYSGILTLLMGLLIVLLVSRVPVEATILRTPGVLYQEIGDGTIQNLYNIKVVNKSFDPHEVFLRLRDTPGEIRPVSGNPISISADNFLETAFFIRIPKDEIKASKTDVTIEVVSGARVLQNIKTSFVGPQL